MTHHEKDKCVTCLTSEKSSAYPALFSGTNFRFFFSSLIHILRKSNHKMSGFNEKYLQPITSKECSKVFLNSDIIFPRKLSFRRIFVPVKIGKRVRIPFTHKSYPLSPFSQQVCKVCLSMATILKMKISRSKN